MKEKEEETISIEKDKNGKNSMKDIVGDYIIKDIIGEGTFSKVKLGINKITGQKVAIKILDKLKLIEEEGIERVLREIKISSELDHPNIIKIYKIIDEYKYYLVIMEYCEEGELFNYIVKKDRLSENESSFFYYQLINAVEYLHSKGIVHRDLKPENILLGKNNIIKLIDFGLSNYYDKNKLLVTPCGSPCYASPEMIRGEDYNGADNDIWATGIILFAMLCGYLPFENEENAKNNNLLFKKILSGKLEYPKFLSNTAVDLMKKILVNSPKKRIKINEIKKHSFYLKGKKIFEKKQEIIAIKEKMSNSLNNNLQKEKEKENNLSNNYNGKTRENYLRNIFSKNNNHKQIDKKVINIFKKKFYDTKEPILKPIENKKDIHLTSPNNKPKNANPKKNTQYLATESNNIHINIDTLEPLNTKIINSLRKKVNLKQNFNFKNSPFHENNLSDYNSENREEKEKENEIVKNITNFLPFRQNRYKMNGNLLNHINQKKEKSMDYPHKTNKYYFNNNSLNTDMNFNSPNKRPLIQVKIYSSIRKNKNRIIIENNPFYNDLNNNKPNIKMNDKLIINLTNDEEKNKSLIRINKKLKNLDKKFNLNSSYKNMNLRLNTEFKTNDNFPFINSIRNKGVFTPKGIENQYRKEKKYLFNKLNNYASLKNKDYLNYFFQSKNNYLSPSIKI